MTMKIKAGIRLSAARRMLLAERLQDYVKRLKKMGIKQLGSGNFADVFQHPTMPNVVVKLLTENDKGYEAYVKFCQKNKANKYCPKIIQVVEADKAFDKKGEYDVENLRLIFMEKLKPMEDKAYLEFGNYVLNMAEQEGDLKSTRFMAGALNNDGLWEDLAVQNKDKDLRALAVFINKTHVGNIKLDLHDQNMMLRGTQVVITDPFSTYS